ncbi:hypothetical protein [Pedobacter xixiisoli]|uniref:Uncharacterized protein n=1 Tax=Pedobacter xixiisoli TaxID=1476464 RepID=A0A286A754_9SPHI|nr:hypothetical protein [Pedobacter xixiisoli]SOD17763.1 hypothetical protein SAMN06297358_2675 [Pedobacter xixiisoli]
MKTIYELNNEQRARLLLDLFPEMKPLIMEKMEQVAAYFLNNEEEMLEGWNNPVIMYHEWRSIVREVAKVVAKSKRGMLRNNRQFCLLAFLGFRGLYTIHCILAVAAQTENHKKFRAIALALFEVEECYEIVEVNNTDKNLKP